MLKSMKKGDPKKPSLSYEAKTAQEKAIIDMKSRAEARKKAAEESFEKMGKEKTE
jgi:hypothetical protein